MCDSVGTDSMVGKMVALLGIKGQERAKVLGFGDSNYTTFNNTGKTLEDKLPQLGAKWLIQPAFCDAEIGYGSDRKTDFVEMMLQ
jgi:sulfite reductase alpha subunit-like flavoprotein